MSAAELLRAIECDPDTEREPLPANTNERVAAAVDALRTDLHTIRPLRGGRGSRNRQFVARVINSAQSDSNITNLSPQRLEALRAIFTGDLPPYVDEALKRIRRAEIDSSEVIRRLEVLREKHRLNPAAPAAAPDERDTVVAALCSQGLV